MTRERERERERDANISGIPDIPPSPSSVFSRRMSSLSSAHTRYWGGGRENDSWGRGEGEHTHTQNVGSDGVRSAKVGGEGGNVIAKAKRKLMLLLFFLRDCMSEGWWWWWWWGREGEGKGRGGENAIIKRAKALLCCEGSSEREEKGSSTSSIAPFLSLLCYVLLFCYQSRSVCRWRYTYLLAVLPHFSPSYANLRLD